MFQSGVPPVPGELAPLTRQLKMGASDAGYFVHPTRNILLLACQQVYARAPRVDEP